MNRNRMTKAERRRYLRHKRKMYRIKQRDGDVIKICEELAESLLDRGAVGMELSFV